jgi:Gluconate 2-dehydrogenase subunit 3
MKSGRRAFLRRVLWASMFVRRPEAAGAQSVAASPLDAASQAALDAVADTIIPRDRDPGALDAGVPARILDRLAKDSAALALYRAGFELVDRLAREAGAPAFRALDAAERERVLLSLARGGDGAQSVGERFFVRARRDVLVFYWSSPIGQRVVDYRPPLSGYPEYADPPSHEGSRRP